MGTAFPSRARIERRFNAKNVSRRRIAAP